VTGAATTEVYPEHLITGCAPTDDSDRTLQKKRSHGLLTGALLAGNEYEAVGLIKAGVEVNTAENTTSPLHASVSCITSTVTKLLIAHGADVNARNDVGERALHLAARLNHINAVRLLLRHGAVVNVWSRGRSCSKQPKSEFNCEWTSLHEACEQGNEAITRELLSNGAHVDVRTATGRSPLDLAVEDNHEQVQLLFREVARSVIALALMSPNLGKDGPVTVDISNFMAAKILDKWSRPSGAEYRCELEWGKC
jgi:ankyrin repeat protein